MFAAYDVSGRQWSYITSTILIKLPVLVLKQADTHRKSEL